MTNTDTFVIVGAGLAGAKAAEALREQGFTGRIVLVGFEEHLPYERPPLSKDYLAGTKDLEKVFVHPRQWYDEHDVELRLGDAVTEIDRAQRQVQLTDGGGVISYDKLLLATGSSPRHVTIPGADADGVHYLRSLDDADRLKQVLATSKRLAVIGAGWIGLEITAIARKAGLDVTVIESASLPLLRVLGTEVATVFADLHRSNGVTFHFDAAVREIRVQEGRATAIVLASGDVIPADAVVVGVGAAPNVELAESAGLDVDNGVLVDEAMRTNDPDIFAVGDIANQQHPFYGRRIRVEHWANALKQPKTAAAAMIGNGEATYADLPYFYTDQYDLGMEYVGYVAPGDYDQVLFRGDVAAREFVAFWLKDGVVQAGMNVNIWDVTDAIKGLIHSRAVVDPARLIDTNVSLDEVMQ